MNRGVRQNQPNTQQSTETHAASPSRGPSQQKSSKLNLGGSKWGKIGTGAFLTAVTILIVAVLLSVIFSNKATRESNFVDRTKFQAVFLNGGQVYFGKISDLSQKHMKVGNIYYLRVNQQVQPGQENSANDVSLVKLGCELHGPQDEMVINREQIIFWENLKDDGQVGKAIAEYVKANPEGQKCNQQQPQQNTNTNTTPTTPAPTAPTNTGGANTNTNRTTPTPTPAPTAPTTGTQPRR